MDDGEIKDAPVSKKMMKALKYTSRLRLLSQQLLVEMKDKSRVGLGDWHSFVITTAKERYDTDKEKGSRFVYLTSKLIIDLE